MIDFEDSHDCTIDPYAFELTSETNEFSGFSSMGSSDYFFLILSFYN